MGTVAGPFVIEATAVADTVAEFRPTTRKSVVFTVRATVTRMLQGPEALLGAQWLEVSSDVPHCAGGQEDGWAAGKSTQMLSEVSPLVRA